MTANYLKSKMKEYDQLISEEPNLLEKDQKLKSQIKKIGIGHNSFFSKNIVEENKNRTKPLFKTI